METKEEEKGDSPSTMVKTQIKSSFLIIGFKYYEHGCAEFSKNLLSSVISKLDDVKSQPGSSVLLYLKLKEALQNNQWGGKLVTDAPIDHS